MSLLSNGGLYEKARKIIFENFYLKAIVKLGSNAFQATGTNTVILFLQKRDKAVILDTKEDYIKLILDSLRYGVTNKPSLFFSTYYIAFSEEELCSLCKAFEEVFDSPIVIDNDMLSYLNKYDCSCSPFDILLLTIRQEDENGKDATFALYTDGDKYKNILETVDFPLYVG